MHPHQVDGAPSGENPADRVVRARLGTTLKGKYQLERVLGVGGMAAVYGATHRNRKQFAIKVLHPEFSAREDIRKRFLREGYLANTVNHQGAVAVLDDDVAEDGSAFLVMELLEGSSVEDLWAEHGQSLPVPAVLALCHQLLGVLTAAHAQGVLHRDLKPANLFLTYDRVLKVLDFGIARLQEANPGVTATALGMTLGTPAFMPPEQALGKTDDVDARSDIWAVGATMFVLISGQLVHEGDNSQQLMINAATRPARSFASIAPATPSAISALIDRALAYDRRDRWQSASEMRDAVEQAHVSAFGCVVGHHSQSLTAPRYAGAEQRPAAREKPRSAAASPHEQSGNQPVSPRLPAGESGVRTPPPVAVPQAAPASSAPRVDAPAAPLAAAHVEVNIASAQVSGGLGRHAWLSTATLLILLGGAATLVLQRALQPMTPEPASAPPAASALEPPAAVPGPTPAQSPISVPSSPASAPASARPASAPASARPASAPASARPTPALRERPAQPRERAPETGTPPPLPAAGCARLLERQSLGETLSPSERTLLRERCKG